MLSKVKSLAEQLNYSLSEHLSTKYATVQLIDYTDENIEACKTPINGYVNF